MARGMHRHRNIRLTNTSSTVAATVNVTCKAVNGRDSATTAAARQIGPKDMSIAANTLVVLDEEITLAAGEYVKVTLGSATNSQLDVVISGVERSA